MVPQVAVDQYGRAGQVLMAAARVSGIPHAFVLDDEGIVRYHGHPASPQLERAVSQVCATTLVFAERAVRSMDPVRIPLNAPEMLL